VAPLPAPPEARRGALPLGRHRLAAPHAAEPRARRWLDPATGWFRRLERWLSYALSRTVFPRLPGMSAPYAWQLDRALTVSEAEVALRGLPGPFAGLRMLLVTDVHSGPFLAPADLQRTFGRFQPLRPDVVLLGGDLATNTLAEVERCRQALAALRAPLGVFAVLGNHDHYTGDAAGLRRLLEQAGVQVLHNRAVRLVRGGAGILLAGIDDLNAGEPDLDAALAGALPDREGAPVVLLSHNPDVLFAAARRGVSLVLAGHTHGGQVRLPGLPVLVRMSRYRLDQGRYRFDRTELVVSRGLGVSGLPLRLACPPEVVLVTLRQA
jgi:hypothetical protein